MGKTAEGTRSDSALTRRQRRELDGSGAAGPAEDLLRLADDLAAMAQDTKRDDLV